MGSELLGLAALILARRAIADALSVAYSGTAELAPVFRQPAATFVTLKQDGELRGCIGTLAVRRSLCEDIEHNALAAAFRDPRFSPLQAAEFALTAIEISLLSAMEPVAAADHAHACALLQRRRDGVLLECGEEHRSTFLPQVWDDVPDAHSFLVLLKRKAGLAADYWSPQMRLSRYTVTRWREADFDVPRTRQQRRNRG